MARKTLYIKTLKKLFALSGNQCAFNYNNTKCYEEIINEKGHVIGEICHIEGANIDSMRYNPSSNDDYRRSYDNLILLCPNHHKLIDCDETYTVEILKEMKVKHEKININLAKRYDVLINEIEEKYNSLLDILSKQASYSKDKALISSYIENENFDAAEKTYKQIINNSEKKSASDSFELAQLFEIQFKYEDALKYYQKALDLFPANIEYLFKTGKTFGMLGQAKKSNSCFKKALALENKKEVKDNRLIYCLFNGIGINYMDLGEYENSIDFLEKAIELQNSIEKNSPELSSVYNNLGLTYSAIGQYNSSVEYLKKALQIDVKNYGLESNEVAMQYNNLAVVYSYLGNYQSSIELFEKAIKINTSIYGNSNVYLAFSFNGLGETYNQLGYYDKSINCFEKSLEINTSYFGEIHPNIASNYDNIGSAYSISGNYQKALLYYEKSLNVLTKYYSENHPEISVANNNIGIVYLYLGKFDKALEYFLKSLEINISNFGENHIYTATDYNNIAGVLCNINNFEGALDYLKKALIIYKQMLGESHPETLKIIRNINRITSSK